jgi:hypothetical protein
MMRSMSEAVRSGPSLTRPLLVWLTIQLAALAIGAAGVPLSADGVQPPEALSLEVMLVTQIGAAALLWPWAFREGRIAMTVIATAFPFTQAAAFLSATPRAEALTSAGLLLLWFASLAALPTASLGPIATTITRATLVLLAIGGAIATYLRAEFSDGSSDAAFGPISWTISKNTGFFGSFSWLCSGALLLFAASARVVVKARAMRRVSSALNNGGGNGVHVDDKLP